MFRSLLAALLVIVILAAYATAAPNRVLMRFGKRSGAVAEAAAPMGFQLPYYPRGSNFGPAYFEAADDELPM